MERTRDLTEIFAERDPLRATAPTVPADTLTEDVTQANLRIYSDEALGGRAAHYAREALFELDAGLRLAFQREVGRTEIEINRRKMYAQAEAKRVFEL